MEKTKFGKVWTERSEDAWRWMWGNRPEMHEKVATLALGDRRNLSIVEVGSGFGYMMDLLRSMGHVGPHFGIDISQLGVDRIRKKGGRAICGNFMEIGDLPPADVVVLEGVLDHQEHWEPMVRRAFSRIAPRVIVGMRQWSTGDAHSIQWDQKAGCYDSYYNKEVFLREAGEFCKVKVHEFENLKAKRREVVLEMDR